MATSRNTSLDRPGHDWSRWIFWIFAAVALLLLVLEHRVHALGWWPHALVALCIVLVYVLLRVDEWNVERHRSR